MSKTPKKSKGKLPSNNYRVQVYDYTDDLGKRHYKSFTAPTKKEARLKAEQWKLSRQRRSSDVEDLTIKEAVRRYIDIKSAALSPSTVTAYEKNYQNHFAGNFGMKKLWDAESPDVQLWISELLRKGLSPKSIRNIYGLFSATLDMFAPTHIIKVTLPAKQKPDLYCPSDEDIKILLKSIEGTELELAVLLAAFGPLRRGEICALESTDIKGNIVTVSKSKVRGPEGVWHTKQPKTYGSYREIEFPDFVIQKLAGRKGAIIHVTPDRLSNMFRQALLKTGLPHFRFHDLRHYAASIMHAIGVPDQYILQRGGWSSDNVMKTVYRNVIDLENVRQTKKINEHFESLKRM